MKAQQAEAIAAGIRSILQAAGAPITFPGIMDALPRLVEPVNAPREHLWHVVESMVEGGELQRTLINGGRSTYSVKLGAATTLFRDIEPPREPIEPARPPIREAILELLNDGPATAAVIAMKIARPSGQVDMALAALARDRKVVRPADPFGTWCLTRDAAPAKPRQERAAAKPPRDDAPEAPEPPAAAQEPAQEPEPIKPQKPAEDGAEITEAIMRLRQKIQKPEPKKIGRLELKIAALKALAEITEASISELLLDIARDLKPA